MDGCFHFTERTQNDFTHNELAMLILHSVIMRGLVIHSGIEAKYTKPSKCRF